MVRSYWQWRGCGRVCHVLGELADLAVFNEADTSSYDVSILWSIPCTFPLLFTVSCGLLRGHLSWEHRKPGNVMEFGSVQEMSNLAGSASPVWRIFLQRCWSVEGWGVRPHDWLVTDRQTDGCSNVPVLLSKNLRCLFSCAVMVSGRVGCETTRLICSQPLNSTHNYNRSAICKSKWNDKSVQDQQGSESAYSDPKTKPKYVKKIHKIQTVRSNHKKPTNNFHSKDS